MIAHISPASVAFEESRNTLTYADRAKSIRTRVSSRCSRFLIFVRKTRLLQHIKTKKYRFQVKKNLINVSYHIAQYTNIISDLRCEIQRLKKKIADQASRQLSSDRADIRHVQGEGLSSPPPPLHVVLYQRINICDASCGSFSRGPGTFQPAEPSGDGPAEGAAAGCLPPADGDQEEPRGAGEQQHGDPAGHVQTPAHHRRVSVEN